MEAQSIKTERLPGDTLSLIKHERDEITTAKNENSDRETLFIGPSEERRTFQSAVKKEENDNLSCKFESKAVMHDQATSSNEFITTQNNDGDHKSVIIDSSLEETYFKLPKKENDDFNEFRTAKMENNERGTFVFASSLEERKGEMPMMKKENDNFKRKSVSTALLPTMPTMAFNLHECSICSKGFKNKSTLTRHVKTHTEEGAFKCEQCPKSYRDPNSLTVHIRTHTGEKPFKCEQCPKSFSQS